MGQKTDTRIFKQGIVKKNWDFRYVEKNWEESSYYLYKTLEIQKYLHRFFALYKIKIYDCKIFYSENVLQVFISFYVTTKTINIIKKRITKRSKKLHSLRRSIFFDKASKKKTKKKIPEKTRKLYEERKSFYKKWFRRKTRSRVLKSTIEKKQKTKNNRKIIINKQNELKEFQEIILGSLTKYTKNKVNIIVTLQNMNIVKQLSHTQLANIKVIFKQLKKFTKKSFFKEAINILFLNLLKRKSAKLLAEFLSHQFKLNQLRTDQTMKNRKDNYFLGFLKQTIILLIKSDISCLKGIKIVIKGRFNKAPRAKTRIISFGEFSLQSFNSKIDYSKSTAYTINGTFGIKVWLCENNN